MHRLSTQFYDKILSVRKVLGSKECRLAIIIAACSAVSFSLGYITHRSWNTPPIVINTSDNCTSTTTTTLHDATAR